MQLFPQLIPINQLENRLIGLLRRAERLGNNTFPTKNVFFRAEEPQDLLNVNGYVIDSRIHAHITFSDEENALGGHLESGTRVFTFAIITLGILEEDAIPANNIYPAVHAWMLVDLALSTGLRVSELAALQIKDLDLKRGSLSVIRLKRKKKIRETLAIGKNIVQHLKDYIASMERKKGPLFVGS